jgi:hypothetical protein
MTESSGRIAKHLGTAGRNSTFLGSSRVCLGAAGLGAIFATLLGLLGTTGLGAAFSTLLGLVTFLGTLLFSATGLITIFGTLYLVTMVVGTFGTAITTSSISRTGGKESTN